MLKTVTLGKTTFYRAAYLVILPQNRKVHEQLPGVAYTTTDFRDICMVLQSLRGVKICFILHNAVRNISKVALFRYYLSVSQRICGT